MLEKTEGRYTVDQLAQMSLVQLSALYVQREELTLAEAIQRVKERRSGQTS